MRRSARPTILRIDRYRASLEQSLARVRENIGSMEVLTSQPGARVTVGGVLAGTTPLEAPLHVAAGRVELEVAREGFRTRRLTLAIEPGQTVRQLVELVPSPAAPAPSSPEVPAAALSANDAPAEAGDDLLSAWWLWTIVACVVVGAGVGVAVGVLEGGGTQGALPGDHGVVVMTLEGP